MIASDMLSPLRRPGPGPGASGGLPCPRSRRRRAPRTKSATSRRKHKSVGGAQKEKLRPRRQQGSLNIIDVGETKESLCADKFEDHLEDAARSAGC
jgi:hypothetical protein